MIVANARILVARVIYAKDGRDKTFTIVDAAMNDLPGDAVRGLS